MQAKATLKDARMSPRKVRPLAKMVRGMRVRDALAQLQFMPGKAPVILLDIVKSAAANAEHNLGLSPDNLIVNGIQVSKGTVLKRFNPVAKGMAHPILKRFSNITVVVEDVNADATSAKKVAQAEIPTLSAQEFVASEMNAEEEHNHDHEHDHDGEEASKSVKAKALAKPASTGKDVASGKISSNQSGGDKKKVHRRKSIG